MARRTTSAAKSPNARSAAAQEATPVATAAMPSSASARPAQSSASPSGIISDHGSQCQTTRHPILADNRQAPLRHRLTAPTFAPLTDFLEHLGLGGRHFGGNN